MTDVLKRRIGPGLLTAYGVGVMVGAGIYVLTGAVAGTAGIWAPVAFLLAGLVAAPTALSYAEFSTRLPEAAGEAAYIAEGLKSGGLAVLVGLAIVLVGTLSAGAVLRGFQLRCQGGAGFGGISADPAEFGLQRLHGLGVFGLVHFHLGQNAGHAFRQFVAGGGLGLCGFDPVQRLGKLFVQLVLHRFGSGEQGQRVFGFLPLFFQCQGHRGQLCIRIFQPGAQGFGGGGFGKARGLFRAVDHGNHHALHADIQQAGDEVVVGDRRAGERRHREAPAGGSLPFQRFDGDAGMLHIVYGVFAARPGQDLGHAGCENLKHHGADAALA